jgi:hypothetical protein
MESTCCVGADIFYFFPEFVKIIAHFLSITIDFRVFSVIAEAVGPDFFDF